MSFERIGGNISFQCNTCTESHDTEERDFNAARADAKSNGWRAYPVGNEWCHACPGCKRDVR